MKITEDMLPIGSILSTFGNLAGTMINNGTQMDLAQENWEKQIKFWNMQNEYNTPKNQVARLKSAGLNPNLIYGSGSANTGNASGSPTPQMPSIQPFRFDSLSNVDSFLLQSKQIDADVKNKDTLSNYNMAKTYTEMLNAIGKEIDNAKASEDYERLVRLRDKYDDLLKFNVDKIAAEAQNLDNKNEFYDLTLNNALKRSTLEVENMVRDSYLKDEEKKLLQSKIREVDKKVKLLQYELSSNPDAAKTKAYKESLMDFTTFVNDLEREMKEKFRNSNAWADAISRWTGIVGAAMNGFSSAGSGYSHFYNP